MLLTFRELLNFSNLTIHAGFYEVLLISATYLSFSELLIEISMAHLHETVTWQGHPTMVSS